MQNITYRILSLSLLIVLFISFSSCEDQPIQVIENDQNGTEEFSHTQNPGASNEAFLTGRDFDQLVMEIDYMPGVEPTGEALESLEAFLEKWTQKGSLIIQEPGEIPGGGQDEYSAEDIRDLEEVHRSTFSEGSTLAAYCIFVDGEFTEGRVLGIAYYNTSCAIFGETVERVTAFITDPPREKIEAIVLNHEFGHLFGLVDSGTNMQQEHHDDDNPAHCTEEECLMYHAVRTTDFFANLFDGSIPELDPFCEEDVRALQ